ncbi:MAG: MBL fold metallo-hydrolase [Candidatus Edwardsbacteria bacterium]|jgi:L-ascorbate metabolism protein UlaG (beta-lactamase superfamily)|nr:MBL fold metallo-hydrolase [Candidatus Edwardsbacteria bacterium]
MTIAIASYLLCALANTVATDPLASYEHDSFDTGDGTLTVFFLGHASLMMTWGETVIYVDPVSEHAAYKKLPKADLVLVTHEHYDHLDVKAIAAVEQEGTRVLLNTAGQKLLGRGEAMKNGDSATVCGIAIRAVPAYNTTSGRDRFHPNTGRDNGYVLSRGGKRLYIAGDTEDIPEMRGLGSFDIAFLPMNQPYTMTPAQVARAAGLLHPKVLYPYHYGDTDVEELAALLKDAAGTELRIRKMK